MNFAIRSAIPEDAAGIARVHVASWQDTYAGLLDSDYLASMKVLPRLRHWQMVIMAGQREMFVLVDDADEVQGFANYGPLRESVPEAFGEINALYIDSAAQGFGWGRVLMQACFQDLKADRFIGCRVWVLADNPARFFYEAIGGTLATERTVEIAGGKYRELAYDFRL